MTASYARYWCHCIFECIAFVLLSFYPFPILFIFILGREGKEGRERKERREGGIKGGRERKEGRKGGREEGIKGGRERKEGRKRRKEGGIKRGRKGGKKEKWYLRNRSILGSRKI